LLPNKSQVRGLLGGSLKNGVIIHIYVAHPSPIDVPDDTAVARSLWPG
jgi:hypothetical protein